MGDLTLVNAFGDTEPGSPDGGYRLFVQPTVTAAWDWGRDQRHTTYVALTDLFEPFPRVRGPGALALGQRWGASRAFGIVTEIKWIAPYQSSEPATPQYYSPGSLGAISFQLGLDIRPRGAQ
jgi:hypothetical protein